MIKWIRTSRLSINNSLSSLEWEGSLLVAGLAEEAGAAHRAVVPAPAHGGVTTQSKVVAQ